MSTNSVKFILPIWHGVSYSDVLTFNPILADKFAIRTSDSNAAGIALQILQVIRPDLYFKIDINEVNVLSDEEDARVLRENQAEVLKHRIRRFMKSNGRGEITGQTMQEIMLELVDFVIANQRR